jgi:hypothetical protein
VQEPPDAAADDLAAGAAALACGDWPEARAHFERSLSTSESPEGLEGLGTAAWWLTDATTVFRAREHAYQLFRERNDDAGAARVALMLAWNHLESQLRSCLVAMCHSNSGRGLSLNARPRISRLGAPDRRIVAAL